MYNLFEPYCNCVCTTCMAVYPCASPCSRLPYQDIQDKLSQPNSTSTQVGIDQVIGWTTYHPTTKTFNFFDVVFIFLIFFEVFLIFVVVVEVVLI